MELFEAIHSRRSVRSFKPDRIADETIHKLLRAAVQAPSAMNGQPWNFAVVQDPARLRRWSERAKVRALAELHGGAEAARFRATLQSPEYNVFYDAGTLIVIGARPSAEYAQADCWLAAQNLQLAACALGLGTCVIGLAVPVLAEADVKVELGLPSDVDPMVALIVGAPVAPVAPVPRTDPVIRAWLGRAPVGPAR